MSLLKVLYPCKRASKNMEQQKAATIHAVLVLYHHVIDVLKYYEEQFRDRFLHEPIQFAWDTIKHYNDMSSELLTVATVLDPTLKTEWHDVSHEEEDEARAKEAASQEGPSAGQSKGSKPKKKQRLILQEEEQFSDTPEAVPMAEGREGTTSQARASSSALTPTASTHANHKGSRCEESFQR